MSAVETEAKERKPLNPALIESVDVVWRELYSQYPGWGKCDFQYGAETYSYELRAELGNWNGYVVLRPDGQLCGRWEKYEGTPKAVWKRRRFGLEQGDKIFDFEPTWCLRSLLADMEAWIHVRRDPATWRGEVDAETLIILDKGKERR